MKGKKECLFSEIPIDGDFYMQTGHRQAAYTKVDEGHYRIKGHERVWRTSVTNRPWVDVFCDCGYMADEEGICTDCGNTKRK